MLTNHTNEVLYTGATNNLFAHLLQHKNNQTDSFTKKYKCYKLVYFEEYSRIGEVIEREKQIKKWSRKKKNVLVNSSNADWSDLSRD